MKTIILLFLLFHENRLRLHNMLSCMSTLRLLTKRSRTSKVHHPDGKRGQSKMSHIEALSTC